MIEKIPNRTTPEGIEMGTEMARLTERHVQALVEQGEWKDDERCSSCAFRKGTVPNGCPQTQMDALKSLLEHKAFFCHAVGCVGTKVCAGWFAAVQGVKHLPKMECPWPFSPPDDASDEERKKYEEKLDAFAKSQTASGPKITDACRKVLR
jgi:hypothetical protein